MRYDGEELIVEKQPYGWIVIKRESQKTGEIYAFATAGHIASLVFSSEESANDFARALKRGRELILGLINGDATNSK